MGCVLAGSCFGQSIRKLVPGDTAVAWYSLETILDISGGVRDSLDGVVSGFVGWISYGLQGRFAVTKNSICALLVLLCPIFCHAMSRARRMDYFFFFGFLKVGRRNGLN